MAATVSHSLEPLSLDEYLLAPRDRTEWVDGHLIVTQTQTGLFGRGAIASTQHVLPGFSVSVEELLG